MSRLYAVETKPNAAARRIANLSRQSSLREKVFEHIFLGELAAELIARGLEPEILHCETDRFGYDVVIEVGGVMRHIQLRVTIAGGARADITANTRLATKPCACIVWLVWDPRHRQFRDIRWFGSKPGEPIPDLGTRPVKHSRGKKDGIKAIRPEHRTLPLRLFEKNDDVGALADRLFGMQPADPVDFLLSRMAEADGGEADWVDGVRAGDFGAIPHDLDWDDSAALADLVEGYRLAEVAELGEPDTFLKKQRDNAVTTGSWPGDAIALWATLFLEHRASRFGSQFEPDEQMSALLEGLCRQLRAALIALEA